MKTDSVRCGGEIVFANTSARLCAVDLNLRFAAEFTNRIRARGERNRSGIVHSGAEFYSRRARLFSRAHATNITNRIAPVRYGHYQCRCDRDYLPPWNFIGRVKFHAVNIRGYTGLNICGPPQNYFSRTSLTHHYPTIKINSFNQLLLINKIMFITFFLFARKIN
jgi:hypothetical protein